MIRLWVFLIAGLSLTLTGCQQGEAAREVREQGVEVAGTATDRAGQEKDEYVNKVQREIDDFKVEIETLRSKAKSTTAKAKAKLDEQVKVLDQKWTVAGRKLEELKTASANAWKNFQSGVDKAMEDLRQTFEKSGKESG